MGIIIGKFRKKKSTYEVLEKLETDIHAIEEFQRNTEQTQKKTVGRFVFISICVYIIFAFILYFYFLPASLYERIIYVIPLIILPVVLVLVKKILTWYYNRKIRKNQKKLATLKEEKEKILDEVKNKETYKVAQTILEKFDPQFKKQTPIKSQSTPIRSAIPVPPNQSGLRYRGTGQFSAPQNRPPVWGPVTPGLQKALPPPITPMGDKTLSESRIMQPLGRAPFPGTPFVLPRAILPRDRSVLDKMVDYLVGDGPSNRYALICKDCHGHNGMALKEEFEYISYKCCYCSSFNPARKKKLPAPKLEESLAIKNRRSDVSESDSDSITEGPIITEPPDDIRGSDTETKSISESPDDVRNLNTEMEVVFDSIEDIKSSDSEIVSGVEQISSYFKETVHVTKTSDAEEISDVVKNKETDQSAMEVDLSSNLCEDKVDEQEFEHLEKTDT